MFVETVPGSLFLVVLHRRSSVRQLAGHVSLAAEDLLPVVEVDRIVVQSHRVVLDEDCCDSIVDHRRRVRPNGDLLLLAVRLVVLLPHHCIVVALGPRKIVVRVWVSTVSEALLVRHVRVLLRAEKAAFSTNELSRACAMCQVGSLAAVCKDSW